MCFFRERINALANHTSHVSELICCSDQSTLYVELVRQAALKYMQEQGPAAKDC